MTIAVMLVDDHPLMLHGLRALFSTHAGIRVVAETGDPDDVVTLVLQTRPDVLVLDLMMPGMDGFEVMALLASAGHQPRIVVLTMAYESAYVRQALSLGAVGYVLKSAPGAQLLEATLCVARGEVFLGTGVAAVGQSAADADAHALARHPLQSLTRREFEILRFVADGLTNNQIAERLSIGVRTVETHRANFMRKLNLRNHRDLIRLAIALRLIP